MISVILVTIQFYFIPVSFHSFYRYVLEPELAFRVDSRYVMIFDGIILMQIAEEQKICDVM